MGLPYVIYLGYWVRGSRKMDYKGRFLPQERLTSEGGLSDEEGVARRKRNTGRLFRAARTRISLCSHPGCDHYDFNRGYAETEAGRRIFRSGQPKLGSGEKMKTGQCLATALLSFALAPSAAEAQVYPARVVKVIVPFTPGSPVDALARIAIQHLQMRIGQSVIIENRPGAGTTIGTKAVATAVPDGYTLLLIGPNVAYAQVLYPNLEGN